MIIKRSRIGLLALLVATILSSGCIGNQEYEGSLESVEYSPPEDFELSLQTLNLGMEFRPENSSNYQTYSSENKDYIYVGEIELPDNQSIEKLFQSEAINRRGRKIDEINSSIKTINEINYTEINLTVKDSIPTNQEENTTLTRTQYSLITELEGQKYAFSLTDTKKYNYRLNEKNFSNQRNYYSEFIDSVSTTRIKSQRR